MVAAGKGSLARRAAVLSVREGHVRLRSSVVVAVVLVCSCSSDSIQPLAWELPFATDTALKKKKEKEKFCLGKQQGPFPGQISGTIVGVVLGGVAEVHGRRRMGCENGNLQYSHT